MKLGRQDEIGMLLRDRLEGASRVLFMAGRGNELLTETFGRFVLSRSHDDVAIMKVLLPDPADAKWVNDRQSEMAGFDGAYRREGLLRTNIWRVQENLRGYLDQSKLQVRLYHFPHLARIVIVDDLLFLTPYTPSQHGPASAVYMYRKGSGVYEICERMFEKVWQSSVDLELAVDA